MLKIKKFLIFITVNYFILENQRIVNIIQ